MGRIVHFEMQADDPERACRFYEQVLGWKITKWDGPLDYWLITTGPEEEPGINGAILRRNDPTTTVYNTAAVESLDATLEAALAHGATLAMPRMAVPGVGWLAYIKDTEGNLMGLMETDPDAK